MESFKPSEIRKIESLVDTIELGEYESYLRAFELRTEVVGEGGNAYILSIENEPFKKFCLKKMKRLQQLRCNSIDDEARIQALANEIGVRAPLSMLSFETRNGVAKESYILMERIIGCNIEQALKRPSLLPSMFDYDAFITELKDMVARLHTAGIFHRDLSIRNVMIDENAQPVIIDFGTAVHFKYDTSGSDAIYEGYVDAYDGGLGRYVQREGRFKDDGVMLKNIESSLRSLRNVDKSNDRSIIKP